MTARVAGGRWRLLVHERIRQTSDGLRYGDPYHIDGAGAPLPKQAARWRWQTKAIGDTGHSEHHLHLPHTELDEVVIRDWFHLEQMDAGLWWMSVGGVVLNVSVDREGRPTTVAVFGPDDYDSPVPGCSYDLTWTDLPAGETTP